MALCLDQERLRRAGNSTLSRTGLLGQQTCPHHTHLLLRMLKYIMHNSILFISVFKYMKSKFKGKSNQIVEDKCGACYRNSCANNSSCTVVKENISNSKLYECICAPGFHGDKCDQQMNVCFGNPCRNNAVCQVVSQGHYRSVNWFKFPLNLLNWFKKIVIF